MPKKSLVIVFGEMGTGKSYTSELIAKQTGMHFYEGDDALPKNMELKTEQDVHRFVIDYLIPSIKREVAAHNTVIVSQALYFQRHRELILKEFQQIAQVKFIHIQSTEEWQITNLKKRPEPYWLDYAKSSRPYFEYPPKSPLYFTIENSQDLASVLKQIKAIFPPLSKYSLVSRLFILPAKQNPTPVKFEKNLNIGMRTLSRL